MSSPGAEYLYGKRENIDGGSGNANRLQFAACYYSPSGYGDAIRHPNPFARFNPEREPMEYSALTTFETAMFAILKSSHNSWA